MDLEPEGDHGPLDIRLLDEREWEWRRRRPTRRAVAAFGANEESLRRLPGGSGSVWTDGRLVIKPVGCAPEHDWVCEVYSSWTSSDVRVPEPVFPRGVETTTWSMDGWGAHVYVLGHDLDLPRDLDRVREAGDAFHQAVSHLRRPSWLDRRDDPWAYGDRLAWENAGASGDPAVLELIERLRAAIAPVTGPAQVIHGDLLPNVLVDAGRAPAVIDWPPYFRPLAMANAVAATDAVTFRDAPTSLLEEWETGPHWNQVLIRALLYRLGPTLVFASRNRLMGSLRTHLERVRPIVDIVLDRAA